MWNSYSIVDVMMASLRGLEASKHPQTTTLPPPWSSLVLSFSPSISTFDSSVQGKLFQRSGSSCRCWIAFLFLILRLLPCWPSRFVHSLSNVWLVYIHIDCFQSCLKILWWHPRVLWDFLKHLALCYQGDFGGTIKLYYEFVHDKKHPHNEQMGSIFITVKSISKADFSLKF